MRKLPDWIAQLTNQARIGGPRVLDDGKPFSLQGAAEVLRRLEELCARRNIHHADVARVRGVSAAYFSECLQEANENLIRWLDKWLEAEHLRMTGRGGAAGLVRTAVVEKLYAGFRFANDTGSIVAAFGPSGSGKTMAAQAMCAERPGAMYIRVQAMGEQPLTLADSVADAMRLKLTGQRDTRIRKLEDALRDTGRPLVVDDAHKLAVRGCHSLDFLRSLQDATGIPMLLLGMDSLAEFIRAGQASGDEVLQALHSRIALWLDLNYAAAEEGGGDDGPRLASLEDVRRFLAMRQLRLTQDGEAYLLGLLNTPGSGAFATLNRLLSLAAKLAVGGAGGDREISGDTLRGIQAMRLGATAAAAIETRMTARAGLAVSA
jgi:DNA transposition AAA+ family ATPase